MSSFTLIRLMATKCGKNQLICRQLWTHSRNNEKLLSINLNKKYELISKKEEMRPKLSSVRCVSNSAKQDHNHSKIWAIERYLSIGLLAFIPISFMTSIPAMDYLLSLSLITHIHWGIEAIVVDYIRPTIFGKVVPKIALGSVYLLSILSLGGLFYFNYTDVGLVQAIRMIAKL